MERGAEGFGQFFIAGGHAGKLLELVEEALDAVAVATAFLVEGQLPKLAAVVRLARAQVESATAQFSWIVAAWILVGKPPRERPRA